MRDTTAVTSRPPPSGAHGNPKASGANARVADRSIVQGVPSTVS